MRKKLLINYLYFCAMSIFHQSFNSCQAKTVEINAISSPDNRDTDKSGLIKDNEAQIKDDIINTNGIQRRQLTNFRQYPAQRLKRESSEIISTRSQRQSNPSGKVTLTSGERRFKKSNHPMKDLDSRKLISGKNEQQAINSLDGKLVDVIENRDTQNKRELRKLQNSGLKLSAEDRTEAKRNEKSISRSNRPKSRAVVDNLEDEGKAEKSDENVEEDEDGGEELDIDEKSVENEENAYEDDEDSESELAKNDDEESNAALENTGEEAGKLEMVERAADELGEEEYDDLDEFEGVCEDANFNDDSKHQGQREKDDGRFKRNDSEASKNHAQKNDAEDTKKQVQDDSENLEEGVKEDANIAPKSSQSDPEISAKVETEVKNTDELESDRNPKRATPDNNSDSDHKSDLKSADLDSDYERSLEEQIQRRIDSIKEEIKREVEEKQKVEDIELNNAKYDEIQNETDEDEDENENAGKNSNVSNTEPKLIVSKRSITDEFHNPQIKSKRRILRRVKRSELLSNADQLRAIEGVDKLSPDVLKKALLRHESIRKRSAPVYGAVDKDVPEITGAQNSIKRSSIAPRRAYVVLNERKRSSNLKKRELNENPMIIPEQAHVDIEDDFPAGLSVDPNLLRESNGKNRFRRRPEISRIYTSHRTRRSSAVIPEVNVAFVDPTGYRPQDEDENDEGNEFDDDGFEDRTSNLDQDKTSSVENPSNYLFSDTNVDDKTDYLVRRKRAGIKEIANFRGGGGALSARRQTKARANQLMQNVPIVSRRNVRTKKAIGKNQKVSSNIGKKKSDFVASFADSSQELSPRLETEYREAFGGFQNDPSGALARFKRVKRDLHA